MTSPGAISGLACPNCGGQLSVPEGQRIVVCPYCELRSLVAGERGVYRYQVPRTVERAQAEEALRGFFGGFNRAGDLRARAELRELFVVYLPYWRARAQLAGWLFGKVRRGSGKNSRLVPTEVRLAAELSWNDLACDASEFGVQKLQIAPDALKPYDPEALRADGMVFEPVESRSEALAQAHALFAGQARRSGHLEQRSFERFHYLHEQLALVFYPLWIARYAYRGRLYQAVVDGTRPRVLYGKAPGNVLYRAAMLVAGLAAGNCLLVNGTLIALGLLSQSGGDDEALLLLCLPPAVGLGLIALGYRLFRYGEEIVHRDASLTQALAAASPAPSFDQAIRALSDPDAPISFRGLINVERP
jgi:DNA-directed RNA polymerase subunit RPC12/RpoP